MYTRNLGQEASDLSTYDRQELWRRNIEDKLARKREAEGKRREMAWSCGLALHGCSNVSIVLVLQA